MRILIIGNGAAGNQAAEAVRRHNPECEIIMFDREAFPEYSACALPDALAGWIPLEKTFLKSPADYERERIKTRFGIEVQNIDVKNRLLEAGDEKYSYDSLIIASGSRPIILKVDGSDLPGNYVVKTPRDIEQIIEHHPTRAAVVGAGNIGVETAGALKNRGCKVYLLELQDRIMPLLFDKKPADMIQTMLEKEGIEVLTGERVTGIVGDSKVERLLTNRQDMECDTVIWAAGVKPNIELAQKAGLNIGVLGGIEVNNYMQCSEPGVYACGDCIQSFQSYSGRPSLSLLWSSAKRQAEVAAANCMGQEEEYEGSCGIVIEEVLGKPCVSIGSTWDELEGENIEIIEQEGKHFYHRLLVVNDRVAGFQSIGSLEGAGAVLTMIRKGTDVSEVSKILLNKVLTSNMAWYLDAGNYLFGNSLKQC